MTTATCISESYVLIRNQRILSSAKIAATAASPTPTRFKSCWILFTIARTPLSLAQAPRESSTTGKSQKLGRAIRAHLGGAAVRGAELVRVGRNEEAPPLSTGTGMVFGPCVLRSARAAGRPKWSFLFGPSATSRARTAHGVFRLCATCADT